MLDILEISGKIGDAEGPMICHSWAEVPSFAPSDPQQVTNGGVSGGTFAVLTASTGGSDSPTRRSKHMELHMPDTSLSVPCPDSKSLVLRGSGRDCVVNLITDGYLRPIRYKGEICGSLVDVVAVFRPKIKNPRQYWKDHKAQLLLKDQEAPELGPDPELVANLYRLKIPASDGKKYATDVAPLWVCVYFAARLNNEFLKRMAKFTVAEIKYRFHNIADGMEWAGDSIADQLSESDLQPDDDTPGKWWEK